MQNDYLNNWYSGWGWFLWFGVIFLMFSSFGNWGYTYSAHRRFRGGNPGKDALDILNERYARGELTDEEHIKMKARISRDESGKNYSQAGAKSLRTS